MGVAKLVKVGCGYFALMYSFNAAAQEKAAPEFPFSELHFEATKNNPAIFLGQWKNKDGTNETEMRLCLAIMNGKDKDTERERRFFTVCRSSDGVNCPTPRDCYASRQSEDPLTFFDDAIKSKDQENGEFIDKFGRTCKSSFEVPVAVFFRPSDKDSYKAACIFSLECRGGNANPNLPFAACRHSGVGKNDAGKATPICPTIRDCIANPLPAFPTGRPPADLRPRTGLETPNTTAHQNRDQLYFKRRIENEL